MLQLTPKHRLFIAVNPVDFRAGIDGLAALCQQKMFNNPLSGNIFVFSNRKKTSIKVLVYDSQGFWLCHKRLSKGAFKYWPKSSSSAVELSVAQLQVLLYNGDPAKVTSEEPWRKIS